MDKINGLILTGGRSTRMGQDKSRLVYHDKPQREHLTNLLRPYCYTVFWSVNAAQVAELTPTNPPHLVDAFDLPGPLNGIVTAFRHDPESAWLVVACDMPLLSVVSLDALMENRNRQKLATVFHDSDGLLPEPLLGIYEPKFWSIMQQAVADGQYSPRQLLRTNAVQLLKPPDVRELLNINDPAGRAAFGR